MQPGRVIANEAAKSDLRLVSGDPPNIVVDPSGLHILNLGEFLQKHSARAGIAEVESWSSTTTHCGLECAAVSRLSFQSIIVSLQNFWAEKGCVLEQPMDIEVGAGTMHPATFLRVLGPEPWRAAYVQPSRRPADGRYGDNPFRLYKHYQMQVVLKPSPLEVQAMYLDSLRAIGLDLTRHDIRFEEDNWESPTLGAWGVGWQVLLDGMEITQFTYFQQAGGIDLAPISAEITYGLERLTMFLTRQSSIFDIEWGGDFGYGPIRHQEEREFSRYYFDVADVDLHWKLLDSYENEAKRCLDSALVLPAYDWTLRCSHTFNTLDARGAISVTERVGVIKRVRDLAVGCAEQFLESRRKLNFPLLSPSERRLFLETETAGETL